MSKPNKSNLKSINNLIRNSAQGIPLNEKFVQDLERCIETSNERRAGSDAYKPSSLHCLRQMYYLKTKQEKEKQPSATFLGICQSGTDRHEHIQRAVIQLCKENPDYEWVDVASYCKAKKLPWLQVKSSNKYETKCYHDILDMSFMCDGILRIKGTYYILEVKTESTFKFQNRKEVPHEHKIQVTAYSLAFGIDKVLMLYENRDICSKKALFLNITEKMQMDLVVNRIEDCNNYVQNLEVPPKEENKNCQYCDYSGACLRHR